MREVVLPDGRQRWQRVKTCQECRSFNAHCDTATACEPVRQTLRNYNGVRYTSDGFDCALPVSIDSHSVCSFGCLYCFADNLSQHREQRRRLVGQTDLRSIERWMAGEGGKAGQLTRQALKYHARNEHGYPCPVQLGAICDPLDNIERNQGWFLEFAKLAIKYRQPVRISTKGNLFLTDEYLDAVAEAPELFWVNFSVISPDDDLLPLVDKRAPPPSERIESIKRLSEVGVKTGIRFRPIIPGLSDRTPNHRRAYRDLVEAAGKAGARAISYEVMFLNGRPTPDLKERYRQMEEVTGVPLRQIYRQFGPNQACMRPGHRWTENIMFAIYKVAKEQNMTVGISDPNWKQITETGCCCGIPPEDPVFGNWQKESCTNQLMLARDTGKLLGPDDVIAPWARTARAVEFANLGVGPKYIYKKRHMSWGDKLAEVWNNPGSERSPLTYFQGALVPVKREHGKVFYQYRGLKRARPKNTPYWRIDEADIPPLEDEKASDQ